MRVSWRDIVTTLTTAGAILLERAYALGWDWPLVSEIRWVIIGIALLIAIGLLVSYSPDEFEGLSWTWAFGLLAVSAVVFTGLGLYFMRDFYVALLMINAVVVWVASLAYHLSTPSRSTHIRV